MRLALMFMMVLTLVGCGSAGCMDATSDATVKTSMESMTSGMTEADRKLFTADCMVLTFPSMMKDAFKSALAKVEAKPTPAALFKSLHGLTVAEIHAKAEETRAEMKKAKAAR